MEKENLETLIKELETCIYGNDLTLEKAGRAIKLSTAELWNILHRKRKRVFPRTAYKIKSFIDSFKSHN